METFYGIVRTPAEAIKLFEACRLGLLPRVQRRLSEKERQTIRSGSVFVWDEREAGMRRWTDGKSWSASRVAGSFLTYREMEGKRGNGFGSGKRGAGKSPDSGDGSEEDDGEPDGYKYKADGLMKQSFSIRTTEGSNLHLISYYSRPQPGDPELPLVTTEPTLQRITPPKGLYPESSLNDAPVPGLARPAVHQPPRVAPQHAAPALQQHPRHHQKDHQQQLHHHHHHRQQQQQHQPPPLPPQGYPSQPPQGYPPHYTQQSPHWPQSTVPTPPYSHGYHHPVPGYSHPQLPPISEPLQPYPASQQPVYHNAPVKPSYDRASLPPLAQSQGPFHSNSGRPITPHALPPHQPRVAPIDSPEPNHWNPISNEANPIDPRLGGRNTHGPLPALSQTAQNTPPVTSPPPKPASVSPPRSLHSESNAITNGGPLNSKKASIPAMLLHPTPPNPEPGSSNAGKSSATGSPNAGVGGATNNLTAGGQTQQGRGTMDNFAVNVLNKQFCV